MELIPGIQASSDALAAEKLRLRLVAENIANAQTTRGPNGKPYQRKMAVFESYLAGAGKEATTSVRVKSIQSDKSEGEKVYNPSHPHADKNGMVEMPNVKVSQEMVDMILASRTYEANLKAFKTVRMMAQKTLQIGK